jgi:hypothetical protein
MLTSLLLWLACATPTPANSPPALDEHARQLVSRVVAGSLDARVGEWVTYQLDGGRVGRPGGFWRMAVVGEEQDARGRPAIWVEMEFGTHPAMRAPLMQLRMLVARGLHDDKPITRMFLALGFDKVKELSDKALADILDQAPPEKQPRQAVPAHLREHARVRTQPPSRLMTFAGTVTATAHEVLFKSTVVQRIWTSDEIPFLHLARVEVPSIGHVFEVHDYGMDARPRFILPTSKVPRLELIELPPPGETP